MRSTRTQPSAPKAVANVMRGAKRSAAHASTSAGGRPSRASTAAVISTALSNALSLGLAPLGAERRRRNAGDAQKPEGPGFSPGPLSGLLLRALEREERERRAAVAGSLPGHRTATTTHDLRHQDSKIGPNLPAVKGKSPP